MTLIDTSAWIEFFRDRGSLAVRVDELLETNQAALCGPVVTELGTGFRTEKERDKVLHLFEGCRWLSQPADLWAEAGDCGFALKRSGKSIKTMDLLIATYAIAHQVPILTCDKEFSWIRQAGFALEVLS